MSLTHTQIDSSSSTSAIWIITESLNELLTLVKLTNSETIKFKTFLREKRKKEWLATRCLLQTLSEYQNETITYNQDGKPHLSNGSYISISHTKGFVAIIINDILPVGIDIQTSRKNINKGLELFLSTQEVDQLGKVDTETKLHIYWCAKEALYKYIGKKETSIPVDLFIEKFELKTGGKLLGRCNREMVSELEYIITEEYYLVKTIN